MPDSDEAYFKAEIERLHHEITRLQQEVIQLKNAQKSLPELFHNLGSMQELNIIAYATNLESVPIYCLGAIKKITGYNDTDLKQGILKWEQLIHPEDLPAFQAGRQSLLNGRETPQILEYRIISGEGQIHWLNDMAAPIFNEDHIPVSIEGLILDVTRRKMAEEQFHERQEHLDSILNSIQDVIWSVTPDTLELVYINPAAENVYGHSWKNFYRYSDNSDQAHIFREDLLLDNFSTLMNQGYFETEFSITLPDGSQRWLHRRAHFARDAHGIVARIDGIDSDITQRKQAEDTLKYISHHDALTNLGNRFSFEAAMHEVDSNASGTAGLIICDVDGLKLINDRLGHEAGDQLLLECSEVLKTCFPNQEKTFRIGGDEFTVLLSNCSEEDLTSTASHLRRTITAYNLSCPRFPISMSIGYAFKFSAEIGMSEVFRKADNMMYTEKPANHRHIQDLLQARFHF